MLDVSLIFLLDVDFSCAVSKRYLKVVYIQYLPHKIYQQTLKNEKAGESRRACLSAYPLSWLKRLRATTQRPLKSSTACTKDYKFIIPEIQLQNNTLNELPLLASVAGSDNEKEASSFSSLLIWIMKGS